MLGEPGGLPRAGLAAEGHGSPAQALNLNVVMSWEGAEAEALVCIWEGGSRDEHLGTAAPAVLAEGELIIPPCVHPIAWTSCWTLGCTQGK